MKADMKTAMNVRIIVIMILLCLLGSCSRDFNMRVSPEDKTINELVSAIYDESELKSITKLGTSINELNARYPIECIRKDGETYRVSYLGKGKVAENLFDSSGDKILGYVFNTNLLRSDFDGLKTGQTLEDVRRIDSNEDGAYFFLYTGRNDVPRESAHYTSDGYRITIEYDTSDIIVGIDETLI